MKIALVGDTHAIWGGYKLIHEHCITRGVDRIVVLGDFGYWPLLAPKFAKKVYDIAVETDTPVSFLPGNHDDWDRLEFYGIRTETEFIQLPITFKHSERDPSPYFTAIPQGCRWKWGNTWFGSVGGAVSIDSHRRVSGRDWFPQERPTYADCDKLIRAGHIDILLTHDCPFGPLETQLSSMGYKIDNWSRQDRKLIKELFIQSGAKKCYHGHHHWQHSSHLDDDPTRQIRGLGAVTINRPPFLDANGTGIGVVEILEV